MKRTNGLLCWRSTRRSLGRFAEDGHRGGAGVMPYNPCKNKEAWAIRELVAKNLKKGGAQAMRRIPPSKRISNQMQKLLEQGTEGYILKGVF